MTAPEVTFGNTLARSRIHRADGATKPDDRGDPTGSPLRSPISYLVPVPSADMTLQQAADELGVHYMTAYRYVKLGLLYAEKQKGSWMIRPEDLVAFRDRTAPAEQGTAESATNDRLESALIDGDEDTAWRILESSIESTDDPVDIHLDLLSPALVSIGQRWADGELSIASEHKASTVATRLIARLGTHLTTPGRRSGTVVIGSAPGDVHSIPSAMFADLIRSHGADVIDLGGSPDVESFRSAVRRHPTAVVALSVTGPNHDASVRETVRTLRDEFGDLPIAIGGGAIGSEEHARSLGADLWSGDSREAALMIAKAAAGRRSSPTAARLAN